MHRFHTAVAAVTLSLCAAAACAQAAIDGEVKKIDKPAGRLTLKHAEVKQFDMPPMTGAYKVAVPGMLEGLQVGDHVRFSLDRVRDQYTITKIDVVK
ncbi:MAG TPA: copper-binding protein [Burkholderiaceae bacterium]|jgi:Cu/Ag efflux protein CusF|nr:copper-binding protein [Burkholderiaceae bacterium]